MKKKLYYVVEKLTTDVGDDIHELSGWKTITVYTVEDNEIKEWFELEGENALKTQDEIQDYLDDNGYSDEEFEMKQL